MSFFRPDAVDAVRRFGEPLLYGAVAFLGIWQGWALLKRGDWVGAVLLGIGLLAGLAVFGAVERGLLAWRSRIRGPGIVSVQEGRIAYFGPSGGAVMALDALVSVEIVTTDDGPISEDVYWHINDELGQEAVIPSGAENADKLLDILGTLPGFDHMAVVAAMGSAENARFPLWSRSDQLPNGRA